MTTKIILLFTYLLSKVNLFELPPFRLLGSFMILFMTGNSCWHAMYLYFSTVSMQDVVGTMRRYFIFLQIFVCVCVCVI